jgi:hypothetical protein
LSKFLDTIGVLNFIERALVEKNKLSLSRFGHGEIAFSIWPENQEWTDGFEYFRYYAGANTSIEELNNSLLWSLRESDIVGIHLPNSVTNVDIRCANLTKQLFRRIRYQPKYVCSAWITHDLISYNEFWELLKKYNVALVGRRANEASLIFEKLGINIVVVDNLEGFIQIQNICDKLNKNDNWDIALISAGIPATILSPMLANKSMRVVIDFGHALDKFIDGENFDHEQLIKEWKSKFPTENSKKDN